MRKDRAMPVRKYLEELVQSDRPMTEKQVSEVERWITDDWESKDHNSNAVKLIARLVKTVKASKPRHKTDDEQRAYERGRESMASDIIRVAGSPFGKWQPRVPYTCDCVGNVISMDRLREIVSDIVERVKQ